MGSDLFTGCADESSRPMKAQQDPMPGHGGQPDPSSRESRLTRYPSQSANSLWEWQRQVPLWRVARNFVVIYLCRYLPYLAWKNFLYRRVGIRVGPRTSAGLSATFDIFFPQLITVGDNTIIGYDTVILAHEYLLNELRTGPVIIGKDVVVGAGCIVLPGVVIGDGAVVSAHSLVNRDVPAGAFYGGVPARELKRDSPESGRED